MAFNVQDFISHISGQNELAYANKFEIIIGIPTALRRTGSEDSRFLAFAADAAELPGVEITPLEFRHYGFVQRVPYHLSFAPITVSFYCTGDMFERKFFDDWAQASVPFESGLPYYPRELGDTIFSKVTINQYNNNGDKIYGVSLIDALPISISSMPLSWSDESAHKLQVTFAYKKWVWADNNSQSPTENDHPLDITNSDMSDVNNYTNEPTQ